MIFYYSMLPHKNYYEGILQLRNPNEEIINFVRKRVNERKNVLITKEKRVKNGIDLYFSSQRFLRALGKKLKQNFPGILKESRHLHTRRRITSKNIYRVNVLFKLIDIKKNKIIDYKGEKIRIKSIGKLISGINIKNGKRVSFKVEEIK